MSESVCKQWVAEQEDVTPYFLFSLWLHRIKLPLLFRSGLGMGRRSCECSLAAVLFPTQLSRKWLSVPGLHCSLFWGQVILWRS